ncbi:twin-arginine translocation pathway signal protein [Frankia sp. CcI156]|uniref:Twin-arginine translocation pathway signal n=1 Tax=Frankia casuarinae (strain DSM 45818 / CECT 9043 / HFP020203 / CcI3) TaxID=106370 RepID=Q2JCS7_FRACC|nr:MULTISPECIES: N-acetylmuramoyl-L-alanine amidase [Frankia]ABD10915.1 Twin-arginine translocation pathway signal [Frankia casuarinae]ETA02234.1 hypothetical protein CcI6DRAFT_02409 [Frankia sp. CcI6]EYT92400.1 hypothetical protein ThrDRAFT_02010 [Frankia casuarinae]KDA42916.1 hypothetical protein BMG523Draft_02305 [Frankia sp. BMG5.23]KFB06049.1 N-acetylmuramoyl-L-alanine amidase [Frankia sp. Allo2]
MSHAADPFRRRRREPGLSRRGILGLAGAGLGGGAEALLAAAPSSASAGPAGPADAGARPGAEARALSAPGTRVVLVPRTLAAVTRGAGPATSDFDIGYVAVRWTRDGNDRAADGRAGSGGAGTGTAGTADAGGAVSRGAEIRLRQPGGGFDAWRPLAVGCPAERDDSPAGGRSAAVLVAAHRATGYELWLPPGATSVTSTALNTTSGPLQRLTAPIVSAYAALSAISASRAALSAPSASRAAWSPGLFAAPRSSPPPRVATASGVSAVPAAPVAPVRLPATLDLRYLPRAAWGADESLRLSPSSGSGWKPTYHPGQVVTVHHTVTPNDDPNPAATVRAIYHFHTVERGWSDIGYHLLIDEAGTLYEGRWSGTDSVPGHREDGYVVTGAHVADFNAGNVGVALLGDLRTRIPTAAARRTLVLVLLALTGAHHLDPLGTVHYVNPVSGRRRTVPAVSGHRDWMATECPGGTAYTALAGVRTDVARQLM